MTKLEAAIVEIFLVREIEDKDPSKSLRRSVSVSLAATYLLVAALIKHVSHSSEHRRRPSNYHRPREAYVHTPTMRKCAIIVVDDAVWCRRA